MLMSQLKPEEAPMYNDDERDSVEERANEADLRAEQEAELVAVYARSYADIALHADIVREEAQEQQQRRTLHPAAPTEIHAHVRFLEGLVERLAAQVSELADRLNAERS